MIRNRRERAGQPPASRIGWHLPAALALAAACSLFLLSCEDGVLDNDEVGGRYDYIAWNAGDTAVVTGTIYLINADSVHLTGTWTLTALGNPSGIGPQTGAGALSGTLDDSVTISLNPGMIDNNVILLGKAHIHEITGNWQWITEAGITGGGRFRMTKR